MAKRRDKFMCVKCGARHRLEVDHIQPVRDAPERAFELDNLQVLCGACHGAKTRIEAGHPELSPERQRWRDLLRDMQRNQSSERKNNA
jgi:5-methylcytosine-specific restriction endonuclease McrA